METEKIKNIILDYCEEHEHLEFSKSELPAILLAYKQAILDELEDAGFDNARNYVKDYL